MVVVGGGEPKKYIWRGRGEQKINKQANTQNEDFCNKESNGSKTKLLKTEKIRKDQREGRYIDTTPT